MWSGLKNKILQNTRATGIEVVLLPGQGMHINCATASLEKNKIIKTDEQGGQSLEGIAARLNKKHPVCLVLNGKGIITRKIPLTKNDSFTLGEVLPNANPGDFYFYADQYEAFAIAHIARKDLVDGLIQQLQEQGLQVMQVYFGFSPAQHFLPFTKAATITSSTFILELGADRQLQGYAMQEQVQTDPFNLPEIPVADQYVHSLRLIAFTAAASLLTEEAGVDLRIDSPLLAQARTSSVQAKMIRTIAMGSLAFIFALLLVNFLVFNHYYNKNKELQVKQLFSNEELQKRQQLQQRISRKQEFLSRSNWNTAARLSYYADRIASLTPSNTLLTGMNIFPARASSSELAGIHFKHDTIQVNGVCEDPVELNELQTNLRIIPEFREVSIKNYAFRKESDKGMFTLEIVTK
ncbi:MAG TPA: hypothetical protein VD996_16775 [Chitinophagaceae bacterium]|nr:hypothetical protein [Chitinophagaceae bacterium]